MGRCIKRFYSTLICQECGQRMIIPRRADRKRGENHIKTMYCGICKETRDFIECNTLSMADVEAINQQFEEDIKGEE